jgi:hypothetical protein
LTITYHISYITFTLKNFPQFIARPESVRKISFSNRDGIGAEGYAPLLSPGKMGARGKPLSCIIPREGD